ncbi:MAG: hypothetical protein HY590_04400 [Candidatus Omnitrophica bacterium]|nr:hypothetical protein [Candidatus Omnitrophota bacterium]
MRRIVISCSNSSISWRETVSDRPTATTSGLIRRKDRLFGNLSSASVLFILHDLLESGEAKRGDLGLSASVGPGFAMEAVLLQW